MRPRRVLAALVAAGALAVAVAGCSDPEPDPARERLERVESRLRSSFSGAQADCILDRLDPGTLQAVDRTGAIGSDPEALASYSDAVAACVLDPDAPAPTTSTTAPGPGSSTSTTAAG